MTIHGNGYRLLRTSNQRSCSLVDINSSSNVTLSNWRLDDDVNTGPCQVTDRCPRMLHIRQSNNVRLQNMHIANSKSYAIYVQGVNGFSFSDSSLTNSGVLGLYIGHGNNPSQSVIVENSRFEDNQTNALALLGVTGSWEGQNRVSNNVFMRNHRRGQWRVAPRYGNGFTGGGQVYLAQARYVTFENNRILDGYCENCYIQRRTRSGVSGLELGLPGQASVSHLRIRNNHISNHDAWGISHNRNSAINGNVRLENNILVNNAAGDHTSGAAKSGLTINDTDYFDSFESSGGVQTGAYCSNGAYASRNCGAESRFGSCVMRLYLAGNDCGGSESTVRGEWRSVNEYRRVDLDGWVNRVGGGTINGQWCLEFANSNRDVINTECRSLSESDTSNVQAFVGAPHLSAYAPQSARYVRYRATLNQAWSTLDIDDVKLSIE